MSEIIEDNFGSTPKYLLHLTGGFTPLDITDQIEGLIKRKTATAVKAEMENYYRETCQAYARLVDGLKLLLKQEGEI